MFRLVASEKIKPAKMIYFYKRWKYYYHSSPLINITQNWNTKKNEGPIYSNNSQPFSFCWKFYTKTSYSVSIQILDIATKTERSGCLLRNGSSPGRFFTDRDGRCLKCELSSFFNRFIWLYVCIFTYTYVYRPYYLIPQLVCHRVHVLGRFLWIPARRHSAPCLLERLDPSNQKC